MSNLEREPGEVLLDERVPPDDEFELLSPREVPLGGPRAMPVRRTLPQRARSLVGAWCFLDHYGPDDVAATGGMVVPPHPHTGLATVSWLFRGEIEHRDSTGAHQLVQPGALNLMTAGSGIQHSEVSTQDATVLHGVQLWVALPDAHRHIAPFFEHVPATRVDLDGGVLHVFVGSLAGVTSPATVFSALVGAQLDLEAGASVTLAVDATHEHALLVDSGSATLSGHDVPRHHLGYLAPGCRELTITAGDAPLRAVLIGGEPLGEPIVMWWNFVGRSHDEIAAFRAAWQHDVIDGGTASGPFGATEYDGPALPAPELPTVRLRPRG